MHVLAFSYKHCYNKLIVFLQLNVACKSPPNNIKKIFLYIIEYTLHSTSYFSNGFTRVAIILLDIE